VGGICWPALVWEDNAFWTLCRVSSHNPGSEMSSKSLFQESVTSRTVTQEKGATERERGRLPQDFCRRTTEHHDGLRYLAGIYYSM
jgi:hypothetical protein